MPYVLIYFTSDHDMESVLEPIGENELTAMFVAKAVPVGCCVVGRAGRWIVW